MARETAAEREQREQEEHDRRSEAAKKAAETRRRNQEANADGSTPDPVDDIATPEEQQEGDAEQNVAGWEPPEAHEPGQG